jgi:uncharacterized OB-fold protein
VTEAAPPLDPALIEPLPGGEAALRGWRCGSCGRLTLGARELCPLCGSREGRATHLEPEASLQTWTHVAGEQGYIIGYAMAGDGEDEQEVRVFGLLDVDDEGELSFGQRLAIRFRSGPTVKGNSRLHHYFVPEADAGD